MMQFKSYMKTEGAEIFGYEKEKVAELLKNPGSNNGQNNDQVDDNFPFPMLRFNTEEMTDMLAKHPLGVKQPFKKFFDQVQWGVGPGSVRLRFGTNLFFIIERQATDLRGKLTWIAKRVFNINREHFAEKEHAVSEELMEELQIVDESPLDSPKQSYDDFERLISAVSRRTAIVVNEPLFHEGVKRLHDNNFLIYFGCRGMGVQAPDQRRIEEVLIDLSFNTNTGVIRMIETNVESPLGQHKWELMPSDFELKFMPTQQRDDIVRSIATIMKFF